MKKGHSFSGPVPRRVIYHPAYATRILGVIRDSIHEPFYCFSFSIFSLFDFVWISNSSALEQVERSIKQEFEEAREIVPDIVANETKFIDFLRCDSMDPYKAAVRISMYWKGRKILFSERWLLPMNQVSCCCSKRETFCCCCCCCCCCCWVQYINSR